VQLRKCQILQRVSPPNYELQNSWKGSEIHAAVQHPTSDAMHDTRVESEHDGLCHDGALHSIGQDHEDIAMLLHREQFQRRRGHRSGEKRCT